MGMQALEQYGDLTTAQLRTIFFEREVIVWARALHGLFIGADPRIVPEKVSRGLFQAIQNVKDLKNPHQVALALSKELDKLNIICHESLAELCALIRDTAVDPRHVARALGPTIFLQEQTPGQELSQASQLMHVMVTHCEAIFGKAAAISSFDALGVRKKNYDVDREFDGDSMTTGLSRNRKKAEAQIQKSVMESLEQAGLF